MYRQISQYVLLKIKNLNIYSFQIFKDSDYYYLDGSDTSVANWMRYVASAYSLSVMNLVACQQQEHIYFYTIRYQSKLHITFSTYFFCIKTLYKLNTFIFRDIMPNEELMVWYCKDFATRLGYDIDPERATYSICKCLLSLFLQQTYIVLLKNLIFLN